MPQYEVDVKAFINVKLEADNEDAARQIANSIVSDHLSPTDAQLAKISQDLGINIKASGFEVDGESDVEEAEGENDVVQKDISFEEIRLEGADYAITLEYIEEGENGDYNPQDPNDRPLLRFCTEKRNGDEWEDVDSGSYCTQVDARCSPEDAKRVAQYLLAKIEGRTEEQSLKRLCEQLSWTNMQTVKQAA